MSNNIFRTFPKGTPHCQPGAETVPILTHMLQINLDGEGRKESKEILTLQEAPGRHTKAGSFLAVASHLLLYFQKMLHMNRAQSLMACRHQPACQGCKTVPIIVDTSMRQEACQGCRMERYLLAQTTRQKPGARPERAGLSIQPCTWWQWLPAAQK